MSELILKRNLNSDTCNIVLSKQIYGENHNGQKRINTFLHVAHFIFTKRGFITYMFFKFHAVL